MAMIFTEGFDSYISAATLRNRLSVVASPWALALTGGRTGGPAPVADATSIGTSGAELAFPSGTLPGTAQTINLGFWLKISALPAVNVTLFRLRSLSGEGWNLVVRSTGWLQLNDTGIIRASGFTNVADGNWHWVEFQLGTGGGPCAVDHITQWSSATTGVVSATWDRFSFLSIANRIVAVDDIIVFNNAAGFPQEADHPIGAMFLDTYRPTVDSEDFHQFARSTGASNAALVREQVLATGNWVQGDEAGEQDLYDYDLTLPTDPPPDAIHMAMVTTQLRNPDVGSVTMNHVARSVAAVQTLTAQTVPVSRGVRQGAFPTDPNTSAAWEAANLNEAQFGMRCAGV